MIPSDSNSFYDPYHDRHPYDDLRRRDGHRDRHRPRGQAFGVILALRRPRRVPSSRITLPFRMRGVDRRLLDDGQVRPNAAPRPNCSAACNAMRGWRSWRRGRCGRFRQARWMWRIPYPAAAA